jgi:hypothetical protein
MHLAMIWVRVCGCNKSDLIMKIAILFLLFASSTLMASETFHAHERFKNPSKIPSSVITQLTKEIGKDSIGACQEPKASNLFEAELVSINKSSKAYLVKPAHTCLCSSNHCPMWMFKMKGSTPKLIWSTPSTGEVEILDKHLNGYRKLKEAGALATQGAESIWAWDSSHYTEIYKNVWTMDADKKCRLGEETTHLMDGKMVEHTIKCIQD